MKLKTYLRSPKGVAALLRGIRPLAEPGADASLLSSWLKGLVVMIDLKIRLGFIIDADVCRMRRDLMMAQHNIVNAFDGDLAWFVCAYGDLSEKARCLLAEMARFATITRGAEGAAVLTGLLMSGWRGHRL